MPRHNMSQSTRRPRGGLPLPAGTGDLRAATVYVVDTPVGAHPRPPAEERVFPPAGVAPAVLVAPASPVGTGGGTSEREASLARWSAELACPADLAVVAEGLDPEVRPHPTTFVEAPGLTAKERRQITSARRAAWRDVLHGGVAPAARH